MTIVYSIDQYSIFDGLLMCSCQSLNTCAILHNLMASNRQPIRLCLCTVPQLGHHAHNMPITAGLLGSVFGSLDISPQFFIEVGKSSFFWDFTAKPPKYSGQVYGLGQTNSNLRQFKSMQSLTTWITLWILLLEPIQPYYLVLCQLFCEACRHPTFCPADKLGSSRHLTASILATQVRTIPLAPTISTCMSISRLIANIWIFTVTSCFTHFVQSAGFIGREEEITTVT